MQTNPAKTATIALAALAVAAWLSGCGGGGVAGGDAKLPADEASPGYVDRISSEKLVNENDALRGVLMLLDGRDEAESFQKRIDVLRDRKIVDPSWDHDAGRPVTKGRLAYMIYQACKIPGGLTLQITGPSQRYCLRELQYRGIIGVGNMFSKVSGMEFQAVLARADAYVQTGKIPEVLKPSGG